MKIRMLTTSSGPQGVRRAGGIYEVPADEAQLLIEGRYAVIAEKSAHPAEVPAIPTEEPREEPTEESDTSGEVETGEMPAEGIEKAVRRGKKKS